LVNPAAERLLDKPAEEVIGTGLLDTFPDIVLDGLFEAFVRIIDTGATLDFEYSTVRSGDMRWYRVAGVKLGDGLVMSYSDITERKRSEAEMEQMHKQLLETSRQAGMAEVATSVLHNVGNVLNSVNISSTLVSNQVRKSKVANLSKVVALLNEHAADIGAFLTSDPKGKQLPDYLGQLAEHLVSEQNSALKELSLLHENIEHIKDIVVMQQSYARISGVIETVKITDLVEDALRLNQGALQRHGVDVIREYEDVPPMDVEKHKILQILVNLVRNAKYACDESVRTDKLMTLRVARSDDRLKISIIDNGIGIPPENLTRIFNHGFTTRKDGHGFGLHSAVLAAMEMGGSLTVHSDGPDQGATFTLELPYKPHEAPHDK
jgi:signal transduction histidine kinase